MGAPIRRRTPTRAIVAVVGALACTACTDASARVPVANTYESPQALAEAVLDAVAMNDPAALHALRVTREEYERHLWPEMPDAADGVPFGFVWGLNQSRSRRSVRKVLEEFGGRRFELVSITFSEEPETYSSYTLHYGANLVVRRVPDGRVGRLKVMDVVLEMDGRWKLMNVDES